LNVSEFLPFHFLDHKFIDSDLWVYLLLIYCTWTNVEWCQCVEQFTL